MYLTWWFITANAGCKYLSGIQLPDGFTEFYVTFSSAATIMISFYYKGKQDEIDAD